MEKEQIVEAINQSFKEQDELGKTMFGTAIIQRATLLLLPGYAELEAQVAKVYESTPAKQLGYEPGDPTVTGQTHLLTGRSKATNI